MGRWSRWLTDRKRRGPVAFVLGGGGPFGALQVGLIQALIEGGVVPDVLIGASVGALNAAFIAKDPTPDGARRLAEVWTRMRRDDLFPGGRLVSAWHALRKGTHVFSNAGLRRIIETELNGATFEDFGRPLYIVAAELDSGAEKWFSSGPIEEPLLASCAMPGIFPPVKIDEVTYIDGGVANNVPVSKAIDVGAGRVYVLNVRSWSQGRPLLRPHDFVMHGLVLARAQRYRQDIDRCREVADVIEFPLVDVGHVAFTDLSHSERLIEAGVEAGKAFLEGKPDAMLRLAPAIGQ